MTGKIIAGVAGCVLLASIALFSAEKAQGKKPAATPEQQAVEKQPGQKGLLDQLIAAYKADDKEKMGAIIKKMEARRDKMQKLAKLNKWHQNVHRRWAMEGRHWDSGWAAGGPGFNRGWGGARWGELPCRQGGMPRWGAMAEGPRQMPGWGQGPRHFAPQTWDRPRGDGWQTKVPPPDWGW
jgi:hypothetical protein